jgi:hypothetical protein
LWVRWWMEKLLVFCSAADPASREAGVPGSGLAWDR